MNRFILLDAGPLGLITNPKRSPQNLGCNQWLQSQLRDGVHVVVPEISDYEVRRELLRARKQAGLKRLDALVERLDYLPLNTTIIRHAALLWAQARQAGQPTADRHALDADVILAAQALSLNGKQIIVATTNVGHLSRFVDAAVWIDI